MSTNDKVLILDIETAPMMAYVWRMWKENVGVEQIAGDWHLLSFAAKWVGEPGVIYQDQRNAENVEDDAPLLITLWELLDEADVVVAHNGRKFDIPKIRARMVLSGMIPYSPCKVVDTLDIAKREFAFSSNKLAYLSERLSRATKLDHGKFPGFKLWKECLAGNPEAWQEMEDYNVVDVLALEEVYLTLRAWDTRHPRINHEAHSCPKCGGATQRRGTVRTAAGLEYARYRCNDCGGWSRATTSVTPKEDRRTRLVSQ